MHGLGAKGTESKCSETRAVSNIKDRAQSQENLENGCRHGIVGSSGHCREEEELQCGSPGDALGSTRWKD